MLRPAVLAGLVLATGPAAAQSGVADPKIAIAAQEASVPAPRDADVASIPALLNALYDTISGPAGARDWNRLRSLLLPEARLTRAGVHADGMPYVRSMGVADFIAAASPVMAKEGFYERGLISRVDRFGNIAQVFSSYESRHAPEEKPFTRGINSMQFLFDGHRWWVVSILWDEERPGNALPEGMR